MITTKEASQAFLEYQENRYENGDVSRSYLNSLRSRVKNVLQWAGEDTPVDQINIDDLEEHFSSEYADSTVQTIRSVASRIQEYPTREQLSEMLEDTREELENSLTRTNTVLKALNNQDQG
jgi:hypothetical protein